MDCVGGENVRVGVEDVSGPESKTEELNTEEGTGRALRREARAVEIPLATLGLAGAGDVVAGVIDGKLVPVIEG